MEATSRPQPPGPQFQNRYVQRLELEIIRWTARIVCCWFIIGIAVSGGVDSMALARLCAELKKLPKELQRWNFRFTAFIVDHRARPNSSNEACFVRNQLQSWGIQWLSIVLVGALTRDRSTYRHLAIGLVRSPGCTASQFWNTGSAIAISGFGKCM